MSLRLIRPGQNLLALSSVSLTAESANTTAMPAMLRGARVLLALHAGPTAAARATSLTSLTTRSPFTSLDGIINVHCGPSMIPTCSHTDATGRLALAVGFQPAPSTMPTGPGQTNLPDMEQVDVVEKEENRGIGYLAVVSNGLVWGGVHHTHGAQEEVTTAISAEEAAALAAIVEAGEPASHLTSLAARRAERGDVALTARALRAAAASGVAIDATWYLPLVRAAEVARDISALDAAVTAARSIDAAADAEDGPFAIEVARVRAALA